MITSVNRADGDYRARIWYRLMAFLQDCWDSQLWGVDYLEFKSGRVIGIIGRLIRSLKIFGIKPRVAWVDSVWELIWRVM